MDMEDLATTRPETPLPTQDHTCTAVIEVLVEATPASAWDDAE